MEITGFGAESFQQRDAISNFKELWNASKYEKYFFSEENSEFALFIVAGELNPMLNMFHHIRNSLAHGRYCVKKRNHEEYMYMEDVTSIKGLSGLYVNSRICLKKATMIALMDFLEKKTEHAKKLTGVFLEAE